MSIPSHTEIFRIITIVCVLCRVELLNKIHSFSYSLLPSSLPLLKENAFRFAQLSFDMLGWKSYMVLPVISITIRDTYL